VTNASSSIINEIENQRAYLTLLAQMQIDPKLKGKVDVSVVVQQTLAEAIQGLKSARFENAEAQLAWLRQILAKNLIDVVRYATSKKRDVRREKSIQQSLEHSSMMLQNFAVARGPSPSSFVRRDELAVKLAQALAELLPEEREAVVLRHMHDWPLGEIAAHIGRTKDAVAGLLKRGLKKLREDSQDLAD
jgi:RNA polymerase sigma-70 factor (ECF subfamily)